MTKTLIVLNNAFRVNHISFYNKLMALGDKNVLRMKDYLLPRDLISMMIKEEGIKYPKEGQGIIKPSMVQKALKFKNIDMLIDYVYHEQPKGINAPFYLAYDVNREIVMAMEFGDEAIMERKNQLLGKDGKN